MAESLPTANIMLPEVADHYSSGYEEKRLLEGLGELEFARSQEIIKRYLSPAPMRIIDIGGGPGLYSCWLAQQGYEVDLIDALPLHVEQAQKASQAEPDHPINSIAIGDARK